MRPHGVTCLAAVLSQAVARPDGGLRSTAERSIATVSQMRNVLSYTAFGVALIALLAFFWRAHGLGHDSSPTGLAADAARKRQLRWIGALAAAMLILAAWL